MRKGILASGAWDSAIGQITRNGEADYRLFIGKITFL
jgi:hypothetical protein